MNREAFDKAIAETPKGANIVLEWRRDAATYKGLDGIVVEKETRMVGRIGINYDNIGAVQEKRESGDLPSTPQPIWKGKGEWVTFPFLIRHVDKNTLYVRMYYGTSKYVSTQVRWLLNGVEASYDEVKQYLTAKETSEKEDGETFTVKLDDVLRIHQETDYIGVGEEMPATTTPVEVPVDIPVHPENIITVNIPV